VGEGDRVSCSGACDEARLSRDVMRGEGRRGDRMGTSRPCSGVTDCI
jgi:hypothetical protein